MFTRSNDTTREATMSFDSAYSPPAKRVYDDNQAGRPKRPSHFRLFNLISNSKIAIEKSLVQSYFVEEYRKDQNCGVANLFQLLVDVSGEWFGYIITPEMVSTMVPKAILEDLEEKVGSPPLADANEYLQNHPARSKNLVENFHAFMDHFIKECTENDIIYDNHLFSKLINFMGAMNLSSVADFRILSMTSGIRLNTYLVEKTVDLKARKRILDRQYNITIGQSRTDADILLMLDRLKEHLADVEPKLQCLERLLDTFYDVFYIEGKCIRDPLQRLAANAIDGLATWMLMYPEKYVTFEALVNNFGYPLCDGSRSLRSQALKSLLILYRNKDVRKGLGLFTQHYVQFIVSNVTGIGMYPEINERVGIKALLLLDEVKKHFHSFVTELDYRRIFTLLYSKPTKLSYQAGEFLQIIMLQRYRCHAKVIKNIIEWHTGSKKAKELEPFLENVVDSFINGMDIFNDWKCITTMLLKRCLDLSIQLNDEERLVLLQIMIHAVGLSSGKTKTSCQAMEEDDEPELDLIDLKHLKDYFVPILPRFMEEFRNSAKAMEELEKLITLLSAPQL